MKRTWLIFVILMGFITATGFCGGKKETVYTNDAEIKELQGRIDAMQREIVALKNENERFRSDLNNPVLLLPEPDMQQLLSAEARPVQITKEIINTIKQHGENLSNLGYYLSVPLVLVSNKQNSDGRIDNGGKFILNEKSASKEVAITTDDKGKLENDPGEENVFNVSFPNKDVTLTFEGNAQKNSFDLVSAKDADSNNYRLLATNNETLPYLCIYFDHITDPDDFVTVSSIPAARVDAIQNDLLSVKNANSKLENELDVYIAENAQLESKLKAAEIQNANVERELSNEKARLEQMSKKLNDSIENLQKDLAAEREKTNRMEGELADFRLQNNTLDAKLSTANSQLIELERMLNVPSRPPIERLNVKNIEGHGSLEKTNIVSYIRSKNATVSTREIEVIIDTYIREAQRENINHDIAIAQMCYATDYLKNQQRISVHNYAGFDAINGVPVRYANMGEGVRAHIQHLKGYTSRQKPQGDIVDKRYQILIDKRIQGTVKTLDALFENWAPGYSRSYGNVINNILDDLYRLSDGRGL